jgi:hypothetical protein
MIVCLVYVFRAAVAEQSASPTSLLRVCLVELTISVVDNDASESVRCYRQSFALQYVCSAAHKIAEDAHHTPVLASTLHVSHT